MVVLHSTVCVTSSSPGERFETRILARFLRRLNIFCSLHPSDFSWNERSRAMCRKKRSDLSREPRTLASPRLCNSSKERWVPRPLCRWRESWRTLPSACSISRLSRFSWCISCHQCRGPSPEVRPSRCRFGARCSCLQDLRAGEATSIASAMAWTRGSRQQAGRLCPLVSRKAPQDATDEELRGQPSRGSGRSCPR